MKKCRYQQSKTAKVDKKYQAMIQLLKRYCTPLLHFFVTSSLKTFGTTVNFLYNSSFSRNIRFLLYRVKFSIITKIGTNEEYLFQNTKTTKFNEITFSKCCSFDSRSGVINSKFSKIYMKSWNSSPMLWRHYHKIKSKRVKFVYHVELAVRILKTETMITLVQKFFSVGRISFKRLCETCTCALWNLWNLYLEVNIFASKFQLIVTLILLSPFVRDVQISTFLDQICG